MNTEFDWQTAYRKSHDDLCKVEARNYVLEQRVKALEKALRDAMFAYEKQGNELDGMEAALREIVDNYSFMNNAELACITINAIARKALGEE